MNGTLKRRQTPGESRRRLAKIERRRAAGHRPPPLFGLTEAQPRRLRPHLTFADLRRRLFGRSKIRRRSEQPSLEQLAAQFMARPR
jgi:hypothetical protein